MSKISFVVSYSTFPFFLSRIFIGDLAGPDFLYLLEFFRVQLSVSVLLGLVFVPKVLIVFLRAW